MICGRYSTCLTCFCCELDLCDWILHGFSNFPTKRGEPYKLPSNRLSMRKFPGYFMALISLFIGSCSRFVVVVIVRVFVVVAVAFSAINAWNWFRLGFCALMSHNLLCHIAHAVHAAAEDKFRCMPQSPRSLVFQPQTQAQPQQPEQPFGLNCVHKLFQFQ